MLFFKNYLIVTLLFIAHLSKAAEQSAPDQKQCIPEAADQFVSAQEKLNQDLMQAIDKDDLDEAKQCIDRKADVNYINDGNWSCLLSAKRTAMARLLIEHKADVNLKIGGEFTLHCAVDLGENDLVKTLLEHKADAKARESTYQDTPLHMAQDAEIAQLLLAAKANPDAENAQKDTP